MPLFTGTNPGVTIAADRVNEPLYAIVPYYNPWRWKTRVKHTERALQHFHQSGATIVFVEIAFGRREFAFQDCGLHGLQTNCRIQDARFKHQHIQLRCNSELWLKENAIDIGVQHLPHDFQNLCWLDSDVMFLRDNWVGETIQKLQHYSFLQMFSHARDLGPNSEMLPESYPHANGISFVSAWQQGLIRSDDDDGSTERILESIPCPGMSSYGELRQRGKLAAGAKPDGPLRVWPGLAWACTRKAWEDVGGLLDVAIWGGGDWHASHALIEKTEGMMRNDLHRNYKKMVNQWYQRCRTHIRRNVGVLEGSIVHHWHGRKTGRGYNTKHALLAEVGFDPLRHLKRDFNGLLTLHDDRSSAYPKLRDLMRIIAEERNEDGNEV